jgi:hypothetical protein
LLDRVSVTPDTTGLHLFIQRFGQVNETVEKPAFSKLEWRFGCLIEMAILPYEAAALTN